MKYTWFRTICYNCRGTWCVLEGDEDKTKPNAVCKGWHFTDLGEALARAREHHFTNRGGGGWAHNIIWFWFWNIRKVWYVFVFNFLVNFAVVYVTSRSKYTRKLIKDSIIIFWQKQASTIFSFHKPHTILCRWRYMFPQ